MSTLDTAQWLNCNPYGLSAIKKSEVLTDYLRQLTIWHNSNCIEYQRILNALNVEPNSITRLEDIPFIPVRLFKEFDLRSIRPDQIFKTMTSSGTSGQQPSKIFLDRETAHFQTKILARLIQSLIGRKRVPMLIIDSPGVLKNRSAFSARGAGILGFSMFGQDVTFALDDTMTLNYEVVEDFLGRHQNESVFIFGFTFIIWQHFVIPLQRKKMKYRLDNGILLHGGGWKKLSDYAVDNNTFKTVLKEETGINRVVNYYGMVEQTGSLYFECEAGHLHAPIFSDVIVRRSEDFSVAEFGQEGIIEVLSIVPLSYPGHALITEDVGVVLGEDDCTCGRLGKYFHIHGRLENAEVRGCSDTHELL
jgi:phenylacetate-coenzyme A ligase PaaK-like adenylate-forming protein